MNGSEKLAARRIALCIKQKDISTEIRKTDHRFTKPIYSLIENGVVIPTPEQMEAIAKFLETDAGQLFGDTVRGLMAVTDIKAAGGRGGDRHRLRHKKTFRVSESGYNLLERESMMLLGYDSAQAWFDKCVARLQARYDKKLAKVDRRHNNEQSA